MRLPVAMGRRRNGLQHPLNSWTSLPVVQPRPFRRSAGDDRHVRAAIRRRDVHALELDRAHARCSGNFPYLRVRDCPYFWMDRLVLEALVLAPPPYFRHTERTYLWDWNRATSFLLPSSFGSSSRSLTATGAAAIVRAFRLVKTSLARQVGLCWCECRM